MAAFLRLAASDLRAAAGCRLRRDRFICGLRRKILVICLLTVAFTGLLTIILPFYLSFSSTRPSSTVAIANFSVHRSPLPFSGNRSFSLLPYASTSSNSLAEGFVSAPSALPITNFDASKGKFVDPHTNFTYPSNPKNHSTAIKSSAGSMKASAYSETQMPLRFLPPDEALIYAKKEIEDAPLVTNDPDLYAPLFLNVSVFKRSYELMERILKVYIYRDGQKPIFHTPELKGIYASEGWFMKLMEQNRHFVVKDPSRAHLFYLPYSAHRMELALYVPGSHSMKPLSKFLRDYVNQIASKYPFWNRTKGSDHFLVACHDWGPYTTTLHAELCKNTIKALCNADASEGIFIRGKDISLPETTIRLPRRPLRQVGGRPVSRRPILAFFAGNMHGRVRPILLKHWGNHIDEDMKIFGPLPNQIARKMSYIEHMKSSKFCICPMGFEVNSPRIVEAIYYECVPVIIADNFVLPLEEVLDWSAFSIVVAEKDIPRLKDVLLGIPPWKYVKMQECVKRLQRHFLWHARPEKYDLFHMILHSIWFSRLNHIHPP